MKICKYFFIHLLVQSVASGLEPLTLRWRGKCCTTVLALAQCYKAFTQLILLIFEF